MVTFALKTWKNKVKMYKVIGIQCTLTNPNLIKACICMRANVTTSVEHLQVSVRARQIGGVFENTCTELKMRELSIQLLCQVVESWRYQVCKSDKQELSNHAAGLVSGRQ